MSTRPSSWMTLSYHTIIGLDKGDKLQMRVRCVCLIIIFFGVSVLITGCGEENITEPDEEMAEPDEEIDESEAPCMREGPPNTFAFSSTPAPGATISSSQEFTLMFDFVATEITVNGIAATSTNPSGVGRTWVISLILEQGTRDFNVEWTESNGCTGAQVSGPYTVVADED